MNQEHVSETSLVSNSAAAPIRAVKNSLSIRIEEAFEQYLAAQQRAKRRPKTLEWHETALGLFGQYLRTEYQCVLLAEMTERHVQGWLESLRIPTARGVGRSASTRHSYARSARAWCQWLVNTGSLVRTPFASNSSCESGPARDASLGNGGMGAVVAGVSLARGERCDTGVGTRTQLSAVVGAL